MADRRIRAGNAAARANTSTTKSANTKQEINTTGSSTKAGAAYTTVNVSDKAGTYHESSKEEQISFTSAFSEGQHPATVKFAVGMTISLGNYESLRIDCGVSLPCRVEDIDAAHVFASDFVAGKIAQEESAWLGTNSKSKK